MRTISVNVLTFDELSDDAKDRARGWAREAGPHDDWWDSVYEDAVVVAEILGIHIDKKPLGGGVDHAIYFSGFGAQGDGASYTGAYQYAPRAPARIREYAPKDAGLHHLADDLQAVQRPFFYRLTAGIKQSGRYVHSNAMRISVSTSDSPATRVDGSAEHSVQWVLRAFADWIYQQLESEYTYLTSDPVVDEMLIANGYEFTEDGIPVLSY